MVYESIHKERIGMFIVDVIRDEENPSPKLKQELKLESRQELEQNQNLFPEQNRYPFLSRLGDAFGFLLITVLAYVSLCIFGG